MPRRVRIFGTGAMACWLGGLLARDGCAVTLAGTWLDGMAGLARDGLAWTSPALAFRARVSVAGLDDARADAEAVVILVKAHQTRAVARPAFRACVAGAPLLSLQNGLGARETLEAARDGSASPVALGVATVGARLRGPGDVVVSGRGRVVIEDAPALRPLLAWLDAAGIEVETAGDMRPHVWRKLVANCAINALTALHGVPNGALLAQAELRRALEAAAREAGAVARAAGAELGADPVELAVAVAAATAENRSSMLQDLERGAQTEIDAIHGAVVREGRRLGVATPTLASQWNEVLARQRVPREVQRC